MKKVVAIIGFMILLLCSVLTRADNTYPTMEEIDTLILRNDFVTMDSICKEITKIDSSARDNKYEMDMIYRAIDSLSGYFITVLYYNGIGLCNVDTVLPTPLEYLCSRPILERLRMGEGDEMPTKAVERNFQKIQGMCIQYNIEQGKDCSILEDWHRATLKCDGQYINK